MFGNSLGTWELLVIVLVILLVFGGERLPQIVRTVAKGWHDIRSISRKARHEIEDAFLDEDRWTG